MSFSKIRGPGITTDDNYIVGIITATNFIGDASLLSGLPAGLGTALSNDVTSPLNSIYYTNEILSVGSTITVDVPGSSTGAYTQYTDIVVDGDADLIVSDGDDLIPDILGLSTGGTGTVLAGGGGRIRADNITNKAGNGPPSFPFGIQLSGSSAINDEKAHSGNDFLEQVYEIPHTINVTEDSTLDSVSVGGGAMMCKRREVIVNDSVSLIIADGEEFTINPLNL